MYLLLGFCFVFIKDLKYGTFYYIKQVADEGWQSRK